MKKIVQGRYALSCTKEEAIERFQEMAGYCRERISDDNPIRFSCSKKGRIVIYDPPNGRFVNDAVPSFAAKSLRRRVGYMLLTIPPLTKLAV